jgi:hypothetical protein
MKKLSVLLILFTIGCSVEKKTVKNNPPTIGELRTMSTGLEGTIALESATAFLWPNNQSEKDLGTTIETVLRKTKKMDELSVKTVALKAKLEKNKNVFFGREPLVAEKPAVNCVATWAALEPDEEIDFIERVTKWKTPDPQSPKYQDEVAEVNSCMSNQDESDQLEKQIDQIVSVEQKTLIEDLYKQIDPGYPETNNGIFKLTAIESVLEFNKDGTVRIALKDFFEKGELAEGVDVKYEADKRLLTFKLLTAQSNEYYHFALERAPDFLGSVRLVGKIQLMRDEQKVRWGTAKLEGKMVK